VYSVDRYVKEQEDNSKVEVHVENIFCTISKLCIFLKTVDQSA
jgi:hypothetical protein